MKFWGCELQTHSAKAIALFILCKQMVMMTTTMMMTREGVEQAI